MKIRTILQFGIAVAALSLWAVANPVTLTFISGGSTSPVAPAYYPYSIQVNGGSNITVLCDDFNGHAVPNVSYTGWISSYSDLSHTVFNGGATAPDAQYMQAAYLFTLLQPVPPDTNATNDAINWAIWNLFDPGIINSTLKPEDPSLAATANADLAAAASFNFTGFNFSDFVVYSPVTCTGSGSTQVCTPDPANDQFPQEFIGEVPEPASLALLGTGLLALAFLFRRRLYRADGLDLQA